jgi:uncharacterized protein
MRTPTTLTCITGIATRAEPAPSELARRRKSLTSLVMEAAGKPLRIFVDADACPVKDETYRVAARYGVTVFVVANTPILIPRAPGIERVVVGADSDAADDWIAERAGPGAIVVTSDIPLASRCVKSGADVIAPTGKRFTESSIGIALATRDLMDHLRSTGQATAGPKAFGPRDRSNFLGALDNVVTRLKRAGAEPGGDANAIMAKDPPRP